MQSQATKCSQKQLAYLAYWQNRGYTFGRNDVIPESSEIPPRSAGCIPALLRHLPQPRAEPMGRH